MEGLNIVWYYIMANFDRSYIKKILCPHTQMITWEASSLLGPDFYVTVHYSTFSATFCCARTGTGTGTGNRVMAILEPWNRVTIFPVLVTCLLTVNVQRLSEKLCFAYCFFQALNLYF